MNHSGRFCRRSGLVAMAAGLMATTTLALPVSAQSGGSVTGKVTVTAADDEACLIVSVDEVDFGTLDFGAQAIAPNPHYTLESCTDTASQDVFVAGTDATGSSAVWALSPTAGQDQYRLDAVALGLGTVEFLTTSNQLVGNQLAGATAHVDHELRMPTLGSSGAGEEMTFSITWTAVAGETSEPGEPCGDQCIDYVESVSTSLESGEDHWYRYQHQGGTLTVELLFTHANGDLDMNLLNAAGGVIGQGLSEDDNEVIQATLDAGTYYLHVFGFQGASNSYTLTMSSQ